MPLNKNTCQFDSCQGASRAWRARRDAPRFPQVRSHKSPLRATASILPVLTKATGGPWRAPYHPHALKSNRPPTASSGASPPSTFAGAGKPWPPSHYRFPWVRVHAWGCVCRRSSMRAGGREEGASNYVIVTLPGDRTRERNDELVIVACERFPLVSCFRG